MSVKSSIITKLQIDYFTLVVLVLVSRVALESVWISRRSSQHMISVGENAVLINLDEKRSVKSLADYAQSFEPVRDNII